MRLVAMAASVRGGRVACGAGLGRVMTWRCRRAQRLTARNAGLILSSLAAAKLPLLQVSIEKRDQAWNSLWTWWIPSFREEPASERDGCDDVVDGASEAGRGQREP